MPEGAGRGKDMTDMRNMAIQHNMAAMNAGRMLGTQKKDKAKSAEKLSTGYKINRAADDAAGLAISEKMRKMIRGLTQGTDNAVDGVSWVQIGDGALEEAQAIIHRMTELSVKSANGTNSDSDRADLDEEFTQCKKELDRISATTKFNGMRIFSKHEQVYYQCDGAVKWEPEQMHVVTAGKNELTFEYTRQKDGPLSTLTVTVPPGEYTTRELLDELDTVLTDNAKDGMQFFLEYMDDKRINATLEGGAFINKISGGLSYLLYDMYKGGSVGALIGTTIFVDEDSQLYIYDGKNDRMTFTVEGFDGSVNDVTVDLDGDSTNGTGYTRKELIEKINEQLAAQLPGGPLVEATAFGTGIKLGSKEAIVTGFKGNMFTIDGGKYSSVFYDNVMHGDVKQTAAVFTGGCVLTTDPRDVEHGYTSAVDSTTGNPKGSARYKITSANNTLVLQPNESPVPVTLTIDEGEYTAAEMADKLNRLFADKKLGLTAAVHSENVGYGGKRFVFEGLKITSTLKGPDSTVGLDETSSAYDTLFVSRDYNQYGADVQPYYDRTSDATASWTGSKTVTGSVTLTSDNNSFYVSYGGTSRQITLTAGTYTPQNIVKEINTQLAKYSEFNGKLTAARLSDGRISIRETDAVEKTGYTNVSVSRYGANKGFDTLFQAYDTAPATTSGSGHLTLTGTPSASSMTVLVGGESFTVPLGGTSSKVEKPNQFSTVEGKGSNSNRNFTASGKGKETTTPWSGSAKGVTTQIEGSTALGVNEGATLLLGPKLQDNMVIKSGENDKISLTLNNTTKTITLDARDTPYSKAELADQLQRKIDAEFGTGMGGAEVALEGDQIRLTSRLPQGQRGENTSISCSTGSSSFLKDLNTVREPAKATSTYALAPSITIDGSHSAFQYQYTDENGTQHNRKIELGTGTYTPDSLVSMLNGRLTDGIQASLSNGKLVLTTAQTGPNTGISYNTNSGGALDVLFGNLNGASPAGIILNQGIQERIKIDPGQEEFTVTINGKEETVKLTARQYSSRADFVNELNNKLKGVGAEAYLSGDKIGLRTTATGTSASIKMDYAGGGSAMKAIFGSTGVEMTKNGSTTTLRVVDANGREIPGKVIMVSSGTSGGLLPEKQVPKTNSSYRGYHSLHPSYIDGVSLSAPVTINQYNDDLKFTFNDKGTDKAVTIKVDSGERTFAELQQELQDKIDAALNDPGKVKVTVNASGVRLEAAKPGNDYLFKNVSGDFYEKVICGCTERKIDLTPKDVDGTQTMSPIYVVGRQDVRNEPVEINTGVNDVLSLDLTRPGAADPLKISVTLDPGKYDGDSLKRQLQQKIDEALAQAGLKEGLIKVGVGDINTGVAGGNDANALNFSLAPDIAAPAEGGYVIDGVRGNAAFSIFYQTDGKMIPAYIMGTKDVRGGVTIKENETSLSFEVDGTVYEIDLEPGDYMPAELLAEMNDKINAAGAPVAANIDPETGRVKLSHRQVDEHEISWVSGGAKEEVFFEEYGEYDDTVRRIQLSDAVPDHIDLPRSPYSTTLIGVNSLFIAKEKNAMKAIDRLSTALRKISELRIKFGSTQNRLEHAIKNNENKTENLEHSDSVIRDTDMADEMVRFANGNILEQAGVSMLTQANHSKDVVLRLLG